jgi:hypothetical protein
MSKQKRPQRREKKKFKKELMSLVQIEHSQVRYRQEAEYDPPSDPQELSDDLITKIINKNAMYMYGVGSRLHFSMRSFSKREFRRIWNRQQGRCAISDIQLYGIPGSGPGGIGIDIINYKRGHRSRGNIRLVSSYLAYTRHVKKLRRFTIRFTIGDMYAHRYPVYTAIWEHIYKEIKSRTEFFRNLPVTAVIAEKVSFTGASENKLEFTWHANHDYCPKTADTQSTQSKVFCTFSLAEDYLEMTSPPIGEYKPGDEWQTKRWSLADPHIDLTKEIVNESERAFADSIKKSLGKKR